MIDNNPANLANPTVESKMSVKLAKLTIKVHFYNFTNPNELHSSKTWPV